MPTSKNPVTAFWLQQTEEDVPVSNDWLCAREALLLSSLRFAKRRTDWRLGRWTAKCAIAAYLGCSPESDLLRGIEIRPAPSGAPEVFLGGEPCPLAISLSHRIGAGMCALLSSGSAVGCDLEVVEPHAQAFVEDYFTCEERKFVACAALHNQPVFLALLWSAKESALKALQQGLRLDTRAVIVDLADHGSVSADHDPDTREQDGWRAVAVRFQNERVFQGWWQRTGNLVRTLVSDPPVGPPLMLNPLPSGVAQEIAAR